MELDADNLSIVKYPATVLRRKAEAITEVTDQVRAIAEKMFELMREAQGVGLAGPQVGVSLRMFVANDPEHPDDDGRVFINPTFSNPDDELATREEGCLSLPGVHVNVRRPMGITIEATGLDGQRFTMTSDELAARIWQHEADHLDGVLILDKMSPMDKIANHRAIKDLEAEA